MKIKHVLNLQNKSLTDINVKSNVCINKTEITMKNDSLNLAVMEKFKNKWRDRALKAEENERALRAELAMLKEEKNNLNVPANKIRMH